MASHEMKRCPRCQLPFECKAGNILECQCYNVRLGDEARKQIGENYQDCLCAACLVELSSNLLPFDGEVYFYPSFFNESEADALLPSLEENVPWKQEPITIMGKKIMQPRLTALMGDPSKPYTYSGLKMVPDNFNADLLGIKDRIESFSGHHFTTALLNYYRDGSDSMGWHRDNEKSLGVNPVIASVSFGATRLFKLKHLTDSPKKISIPLTHGSLLLMAGATQHHWYHSIPKQTKPIGARVNITFRKLV
ncbi:MAG: alpha-ketoglutarate-dependent dioxygenase AlkB [Chitinophagaceae bacterium]|nr:MAG: alpha-ketoglutarate-dependent dioxygenase AlkB [Chitinophagaceae bacterium]